MKIFFQRLIKRRSKLFWFSFLVAFCICIFIFGKVCFGYLPIFLRDLMHRIPYINTNIEVIAEMDKDSLPTKEAFVVGTPIYQFQPELALVGFLSGIDMDDAKVLRFRLGIAKKYEISILRDDTRFEFVHTSPSFITILQTFLREGHGDTIKQQMFSLATKNQQKIANIFARLGEILGKELKDQNLANQILNNQTLRKEIMHTVEEEIFSRIDMNEIIDSVEKNNNTTAITSIFRDNIEWQHVAKQAMESGTEGAIDEVSSYFIDPKHLSNNDGGKVIKVITTLLTFVISPKSSMRKAGQGFEKGAWKGGWGMTRKELARVFKSNNSQIMTHGSEVLQKAAQDIQLMDKVFNGFQALAKNEKLLNHIKSRYGDEVAKSLVLSFTKASHDETIVSNMDEIVRDIQNLTSRWFERLLLNEKRSGPNPQLLMAIREGLSRKAEPQIICFPGQGLRVNKGYIYQIKGKN